MFKNNDEVVYKGSNQRWLGVRGKVYSNTGDLSLVIVVLTHIPPTTSIGYQVGERVRLYRRDLRPFRSSSFGKWFKEHGL